MNDAIGKKISLIFDIYSQFTPDSFLHFLLFSVIPVPSGPPQNVIFISRSQTSIEISWKAPVSTRNNKLTAYEVCYSTRNTFPECLLHNNTKTLSHAISNLRPSTKYFVTVSASTKFSHGEKSLNVSKITNGGNDDFESI